MIYNMHVPLITFWKSFILYHNALSLLLIYCSNKHSLGNASVKCQPVASIHIKGQCLFCLTIVRMNDFACSLLWNMLNKRLFCLACCIDACNHWFSICPWDLIVGILICSCISILGIRYIIMECHELRIVIYDMLFVFVFCLLLYVLAYSYCFAPPSRMEDWSSQWMKPMADGDSSTAREGGISLTRVVCTRQCADDEFCR